VKQTTAFCLKMIVPRSERLHPELGSIFFDDGKAIPGVAGAKDGAPMWICWPDGSADSELEFYLPGDALGPQSLERAVAAVQHRARIEAEGRRLSGSNVSLAWIDFTTDPPRVAFPDNDHDYVIWKGWLDENLAIRDFKEETW